MMLRRLHRGRDVSSQLPGAVSFLATAEDDLFRLYEYIAKRAGHAVAGGYLDRIEAACMALETYPERGTRRDDILPGLRVMGFERRATILFQIVEDEVLIIRVLYGGRSVERALRRLALG